MKDPKEPPAGMIDIATDLLEDPELRDAFAADEPDGETPEQNAPAPQRRD